MDLGKVLSSSYWPTAAIAASTKKNAAIAANFTELELNVEVQIN